MPTLTISPTLIDSEITIHTPSIDLNQLSAFHQSLRDDLNNIFFDSATGFAQNIAYTHTRKAQTRTYKGIFTDSYYPANMDNESIATVDPTLLMRISSLLFGAEKGDVCIINKIKYEVITPKPDGVGGIELKLRRL